MGAYGGTPVEPVRGTPLEVADQVRAFAEAGAEHVQLVVDPITRDSIEWFAPMLAALDA
jgi:alkanesulfonate monooxygenase SsuD/methylene tetrahydromethanopterin reductase-like flavin-dependent oxidoreductase (luciferase family)